MKGLGEIPFWEVLENIINSMTHRRLAEVFRVISFHAHEKYGPHSHLRMEINYVKKGSCTLHLKNESVDFKENEIMIIASHVEHTFEAGPRATVLMQLEFMPEIYQRLNPLSDERFSDLDPLEIFSDKNRLIKIKDNERINGIIHKILDEMTQKKKGYQYLVMMHYAEMLILVQRHLDEYYLPLCANESLKKAVSFIRSNYQKELTAKDISEHASVGERYLRNLFRRHLGISPMEYVTRLRINKSADLMRDTDLSIKEICFLCGFKSPQYFSRLFKRHTGISPKEIRGMTYAG